MKNNGLKTRAENLSAIKARLAAKPFRPHRLFANNHAQTIMAFLYPRRRAFRSSQADEARLFELEPNVRILAHCRWQTGNKRDFPTLVLVHGLEGSSESIYMLGTADKAFRAGFNTVRLNIRTCGGTEHLTETLYHSGLSGDLRAVITELIECDKLNSIYLAGFSLGGNMSLKLAGEWGDNAPPAFRGVSAVSPSVDLAACADLIEKRSNVIYQQRFLKALKERMQRVARLYPERYSLDKLAQTRTIREFDRHFTAVHWGFRDEKDYYARCSAFPLIEKIRIPTLIIHAQDDPFVPFEPFRKIRLDANPFVTLLAPERGGHVGFLARNGKNEDLFWAENRLVEFFEACHHIAPVF